MDRDKAGRTPLLFPMPFLLIFLRRRAHATPSPRQRCVSVPTPRDIWRRSCKPGRSCQAEFETLQPLCEIVCSITKCGKAR